MRRKDPLYEGTKGSTWNKSALLFYHKLRDDLEQEDFKVNPYDPCVANKHVNGSHMTIVWHVMT